MTKESAREILNGMIADMDMAGRVAGGDFADFADADLSEAERSLLSAAAGEMDDDVQGFAAYIKFDGVDGESIKRNPQGYTEVEWTYLKDRPNTREAFSIFKF